MKNTDSKNTGASESGSPALSIVGTVCPKHNALPQITEFILGVVIVLTAKEQCGTNRAACEPHTTLNPLPLCGLQFPNLVTLVTTVLELVKPRLHFIQRTRHAHSVMFIPLIGSANGERKGTVSVSAAAVAVFYFHSLVQLYIKPAYTQKQHSGMQCF